MEEEEEEAEDEAHMEEDFGEMNNGDRGEEDEDMDEEPHENGS